MDFVIPCSEESFVLSFCRCPSTARFSENRCEWRRSSTGPSVRSRAGRNHSSPFPQQVPARTKELPPQGPAKRGDCSCLNPHKQCLTVFLHFPSLPGFSTQVYSPLLCLGNRGLCLPFRCLAQWQEIGSCFLPTQKCCRMWRKTEESPWLRRLWRKKQFS